MTWSEFIIEINQKSREEYFEIFGEIEERLRRLEYSLNPEQIKDIAETTIYSPVWVKIHMLSFCMKVSGQPQYAEQILDLIEQSDMDEVGEYNRLSHYWQISTAVFKDSRLKTPEVEMKLLKLYRSLFESFCSVIFPGIKKRNYLKKEEQNREQVFVFISQVLTLKHAPTKTLLDRCYVLQKYVGKRVFIVNTAMQVPKKGQAPFYDLQTASYLYEYAEKRFLEFKGEKFEFYQCKDDMPNLQTIADLVMLVKEKKPCYLVNIGGSDICADICGMIVPEITVSTVFSGIAPSCGEYQITGAALTEAEREGLKILGVEETKVKHTLFSFSFKEQSHKYTRADLGIWEKRFVLVVVGWRLDAEADRNFFDCLSQILERNENIGVVFIGKFDRYEEQVKNNLLLRCNTRYLGMQEDVLAVMECCDLYINPKRQGGGSSAAEALYQGVPVMTLPYGDVFAAAGEEFVLEDYKKMVLQTIKYATEPEFYEKMSRKAKKRAGLLLDSNATFGETVQEIEEELG